MRKHRSLSCLVLVMFMFTIVAGFGASQATAASNLTDINGHWAQSQIENLITKGVISGYPDNTFKPGNTITRAEFMVMVNRTFSFTNTTTINFKDVQPTDWFAAEIGKAQAAGYISGYPDGTMKPNNQISRQEAAIMIAKAAKLDISVGADLNFKDAASIADWSRAYIAAMVKANYLNGYPDGTFQPDKSIQRAEAAVILNAVIKTAPPEPVKTNTFDKAGTYGPATGTDTITDNVTISADGVILQNTTIKGNLLISEAVGQGNVTLKNVTVTGTTTIKGGGENSIAIENCSLGKVIVNKADGKLRIVLSSGPKISELIIDSAVKVVGQGTITKATINKNGVTIEATPGTTNVARGVTASVGGKTISGPSGGGGGGGGGTVTSANAGTKAELVNALKSGNITTITLTANIDMGSDVAAIGRALTLDGKDKTLTGSVTVNASGATLRNITITGNFTAGAGIGDGDLTLDSVTVQGATTIEGGGSNSIHLAGATNLKGAITLKKEGLRLVVDGGQVRLEGTVSIEAPVILAAAANVDTSNVFMGAIEVPVSFTGSTAIQILAALNVAVTIDANNVQIAVGQDVALQEIVANGSGVSIENAGTIETVTANAPVNLEGNPPNTTGGTDSVIVKVGKPAANPPAGAVANGTAVALTSATTGAKIYYTTDGSEPTSDSTVYSATNKPVINFGTGSTFTIKAFAAQTGMTDSDKVTIKYTKRATAPPTLTNVTVGDIAPLVSGTNLTFRIDPAVRYETGTATLSDCVSFQIKSGDDIVTGDATTDEDLVDRALELLATQGGTPGDGVLGSTLIDRSPVTIILSAGSFQTTYTISFVPAVAPVLTNVTVGGITPEVSGTNLTFKVDPEISYNTGTATLSDYVGYRIQSGTDIDLTGSATPSENLLTTALNLLKAEGGTPEDGVLGSTLIAKSPVTITLTAGAAQTVYKIYFFSSKAPTVTDVTIGWITGEITPEWSGNNLTFKVNPANRYTTGTAKLSTNVSYRVQSGDIDVDGTADTDTNLIDEAMKLLALKGGTPEDGVLGSTLIAYADVTITLEAGGAQSVYKIYFEAIDKTTLTTAITNATALLNSKTVGTAAGNVPQAAHDVFKAAIDQATTVNNSTTAHQPDLDAQVTALATASSAFENAVIAQIQISGIVSASNLGKIKFDTNVKVTAEDLAGKIKANDADLTTFGTPEQGTVGNNWNAIIPGAEYGTTYTITVISPLTISGASTVSWTAPPVTPAAPTNPVQNDDANTFDWTNVAEYSNVTDYEYSLDSGVTWNTCTVKPINVGDVALVVGAVRVRVKADSATNRLAGAVLQSTQAYTVAPEGILVSSLGAEGDLSVTANVFNIQDNSFAGLRTFGIAKDRLPELLKTANGYKLKIGTTEFTLEQNTFNTNLYNVSVSDSYTADQIRNGLLVGIF